MTIDDAVGLNDKNYTISNEQAQAILDMRLNKLTNLEQEVILKDYNDAVESIKKYLKILSNPSELDNLMIIELEEIKSLYFSLLKDFISAFLIFSPELIMLKINLSPSLPYFWYRVFLFSIEGVVGVFFGNDFITITKGENVYWEHIKPALLGTIMEFMQSGEEIIKGTKA